MIMFDFEYLKVYQVTRLLNKELLQLLQQYAILDPWLKNQLKRASISIMLNLAEGSGRATKKGRMHFYTIARSSLLECVALLDVLLDLDTLNEQQYRELYKKCEHLSKMILHLIRALDASSPIPTA